MLTTILRILIARRLKPFIFEKREDVSLDYKDHSIGIYVHIPFCRKICAFCPYYKVLYEKNLSEGFRSALLTEIEIVGDRYRNREVDSVYFGGGTPALLIDHLPEIVSRLRKFFDIRGDFAIELHPLDLTEENLKKLKSTGFEMVSVGVQSFSKECLYPLGREEDNDIKKKLSILKDFRFKTIDIDLIFGIPNQSIETLREDFKTAVELGATQISTYPFIDFSFLKNTEKPLGKKEKRIMLGRLTEIAKEMGFERTSVWTFARKGSQRYSSVTRDSFIGFGPSASSLGDNSFKINTFSLGIYIDALNERRLPPSLVLDFDIMTRASYWLFWNSYNMDINRDSFYRLFGINLEEIFPWQLKLAELLGIIRTYERGYRLTERGAYYFHLVEQEYTHKYIDKIWSIQKTKSDPDRIII